MPSPAELRLEPCGGFPVLPVGSPLPEGYGGIEISTADRMVPGLEPESSPLIGVDGAVAAQGWGSGVIAVPPGRHLIRVERGGMETLSRVEDVAAGQTVGLDYRVSVVRNRGRYLVGHAGFGPKGRTRATNRLNSGGSATTRHVVIPAVVGGAIMSFSVSLGTLFTDGILQQLLMVVPATVVVAAVAVLIPLLTVRNRRRVERELAHEPRQWGEAWRVFDGGPMPAMPGNRGALLLDVRIRIFAVAPGWTPPPRLRIDGRDVPIDFGCWWIPVETGEHRVEITPAGDEAAPQQRTVTVVAGQTHRGKATVRGIGITTDVNTAPRLKVGFRLK